MKQKKFSKLHLLWIIPTAILLLAAMALGAVAAVFTITEYRPDDVESVEVKGDATKELHIGDDITLFTFNTGFGALDATRDFFMDGGSIGSADTKEAVEKNMAGMAQIIADADADVVFLQEVDLDAARSFGLNQVEYYAKEYDGKYNCAKNYDAIFVPLPINAPMGYVESSILTMTRYNTESCRRISLPNTHAWPVSTCQLKRCIMVQEVTLEGTDAKLILVNIHLEAYSDEAGKAAQTKILHDLVEKEYKKGNYVIVGGDFNQTLPGVDLSKYPVLNDEYFEAPIVDTDGLPEGFRYVVDDTYPTARLLNEVYSGNHETTQLYVIDGFLISPNVRINSINTLNEEFKYTDHNPVTMNVTLLADGE